MEIKMSAYTDNRTQLKPKPAVETKMEASEVKPANDNKYEHPINEKMRAYQKVVKQICLKEKRSCSTMEVFERLKRKMKLNQSTAYRIKDQCVTAGLIDQVLGRHGSLKPHGYTLPIDTEV